MQGQGHAWAQLNSRPSHVGESMALAERLVLLGVERLPFQVGLADLGKRAQVVRSRGADPAPRSPPQPRVQHWLLHRHRGAGGSEQAPKPPAQTQARKTSWHHGPCAAGIPHAGYNCQGESQPPPAAGEGCTWLTAQTKQVSCQLNPSASRNRSPASILKSQPRHLVPNIFS